MRRTTETGFEGEGEVSWLQLGQGVLVVPIAFPTTAPGRLVPCAPPPLSSGTLYTNSGNKYKATYVNNYFEEPWLEPAEKGGPGFSYPHHILSQLGGIATDSSHWARWSWTPTTGSHSLAYHSTASLEHFFH